MKVKNFKINVVVDNMGEKTLMTVEEDFTIANLKKQLNLPEGCRLTVEGIKAPDCAFLEDGDLVEVHYDILDILGQMSRRIKELEGMVGKKYEEGYEDGYADGLHKEQ